MFEFPESIAGREELEDAWRLKLQQAYSRYSAATEACRKIHQEQMETRAADGSAPADLMRAQVAASQALADYVRILRVFTDLTVHGKLPVEDTSANTA